jgi:hypothetical protein
MLLQAVPEALHSLTVCRFQNVSNARGKAECGVRVEAGWSVLVDRQQTRRPKCTWGLSV